MVNRILALVVSNSMHRGRCLSGYRESWRPPVVANFDSQSTRKEVNRRRIYDQLTRSVLQSKGRTLASTGANQDGAILILALVFILLIAFSVLGLLTFGGGGIKDAASLQGQRGLEYAADGAASAAIQSVRYSYNAYDPTTATPPGICLPGTGVMTIPEDSNNYAMIVFCSGTVENAPTPQQYTRVVAFYACLQSAGSCTESNAIVSATVGFQDLSSAGIDGCYDNTVTGTSDTMTCGTGMVITSWIYQNFDT